jgi:DNA-binding transcriptional MerR regulator
LTRLALYRIGTAARLSGVEVGTLRNWEQRYGIVVAKRSASGQRLYTLDDIERLRELKGLIDGGLSAGEAHGVLVRELREESLDERRRAGASARADARRLRGEVAETHARTAAEHERAARRLSALADRTDGVIGERFRELARQAEERAIRTRALAELSRARSGQTGGATVHELRQRRSCASAPTRPRRRT